VLIRPYKESDFIDIKSINELSHETPSPAMLLKAEADQGKTWVAEIDSVVSGFIIGKIKHGKPYVYNIAVSQVYRKQGVATELIKAFEEYYSKLQKKENSCFWLQVNTNNPAQKLYFDLGYRVGYVDEDFYGAGKHALCMYKSSVPFNCGMV
jgi:ribosomal protein S18 acetylase RimI-like enzyme